MNRSLPVRSTGGQAVNRSGRSRIAKIDVPGGQAFTRCENGSDLGTVFDFSKLGTIGRVCDDQFCAAGFQTMFNRFGTEGGEKRLIDSADTPRAENGCDEFWRARQEAGNDIASADTCVFQYIARTSGHIAQVLEGEFRKFAIGRNGTQGDAIITDMPVAAFNTGIDAGFRIAVKLCDSIFDAKLRNGILITRQPR